MNEEPVVATERPAVVTLIHSPRSAIHLMSPVTDIPQLAICMRRVSVCTERLGTSIEKLSINMERLAISIKRLYLKAARTLKKTVLLDRMQPTHSKLC